MYEYKVLRTIEAMTPIIIATPICAYTVAACLILFALCPTSIQDEFDTCISHVLVRASVTLLFRALFWTFKYINIGLGLDIWLIYRETFLES